VLLVFLACLSFAVMTVLLAVLVPACLCGMLVLKLAQGVAGWVDFFSPLFKRGNR
jgi:hypothetical protein